MFPYNVDEFVRVASFAVWELNVNRVMQIVMQRRYQLIN